MKVLSEIPRSLLGRGPRDSIPIGCECGESFLFPGGKGRAVTCPTCKVVETFADDDATFDVSHNGQSA